MTRKVLVVSPVFGGSFAIAHYAVSALVAEGANAELLDMRSFADAYGDAERAGDARPFYRQTHAHIWAAVERFDPDLVLALAQAPIKPRLLAKLRRTGVGTALWFVEHFQRFTSWRTVAAHYDHVFTIQREPFLTALREIGVESPQYLPVASDPGVHISPPAPVDATLRCRLAFFGTPHFNRIEAFASLTDLGLGLWGEGWELVGEPLASCVRQAGRMLDELEERDVYWGADIVLNLHSRGQAETVFDFVNPRTFVAAGCGAFQLVDRRDCLGEHYELGTEVITYDSLAQLRGLVERFGADEAERRRIADAAQQRTLAEHRYEHRMRRLLAWVFGG